MTGAPMLTKRQFIWRIGVLYWGGLMFLFFAVVMPLIRHFTIGKPLTIKNYAVTAVASAVAFFPSGLLFGWAMWLIAQGKRNRVKKLQDLSKG